MATTNSFPSLQPIFKESYSKRVQRSGKWKDQLPGGKADKYVPSNFDSDQLEHGRRVEMEHTKDPKKAIEIAMDYLVEDKDYYKKLLKIYKD